MTEDKPPDDKPPAPNSKDPSGDNLKPVLYRPPANKHTADDNAAPPPEIIQILMAALEDLPSDKQLETIEAITRISQLPEEEQRITLSQISMKIERHSGPIPHPSLLNEYNPKAQAEIFKMAREQQAHENRIEAKIFDTQAQLMLEEKKTRRHGVYLGFVLAMTALIAGAILTAMKADVTTFLLVIAAVGTLATVYVLRYGQGSQKEPEAKAQTETQTKNASETVAPPKSE